MAEVPTPPEVLARRDPDGPDFPGRRQAERVLGAAIILFLVIGLWQGVAALSAPGPQRRLAEVLRIDAFLAGRTAAAVNRIMAADLPSDRWLRAAGGVLRWIVFGSGGTQVWPGCDGWLFLTEELRPWPDGRAALASRAELAGDIAAFLAEHDIALTVLVVPDKARLLPHLRCGAPYAAEAEARFDQFAAMLAERRVQALDLRPLLGPDAPRLFHRTDTHWNQDGARRAAAALASRLPASLTRDARFATSVAAAETPGPGDLLRLMSLDGVPDALRPPADRERVETTSLVDAGASAEASILDDDAGPAVALLGSSYSLNGNFHGALQQAAGLPVGNVARAGGGFAGAARAFFGSAAWRETPPRAILWEFPERALTQPLTAEDRALRNWLDTERLAPR
jgi:alginate O-acetyltransferase complex protein AlgJ